MNEFAFEIGQKVKVSISGESGMVIGRAQYASGAPMIYVHYVAADGRAVTDWFNQSLLEAIPA